MKGHDDMRQDAVMQQVYQMVNTLLLRNKETRSRSLHIRTYKVVPLTQRAGVLEWVRNTIPIGDYLVAAHAKYHPNDMTPYECRYKLHEAEEKGLPHAKKVAMYESVTKNCQPVFRHFWLEKFPDPNIWFAKRLAYVRSVAATSMVGHILGLGDRHAQNILLDVNTAEVVHIDLGIAFEQGKAP